MNLSQVAALAVSGQGKPTAARDAETLDCQGSVTILNAVVTSADSLMVASLEVGRRAWHWRNLSDPINI